MKRALMIKALKKEFPLINGICQTEDLGYSKGGIHLGDCAEGGEIDGQPACDYYVEDPNESVYVMGIHKKLLAFVETRGWFIECYNPGIYMAWE